MGPTHNPLRCHRHLVYALCRHVGLPLRIAITCLLCLAVIRRHVASPLGTIPRRTILILVILHHPNTGTARLLLLPQLPELSEEELCQMSQVFELFKPRKCIESFRTWIPEFPHLFLSCKTPVPKWNYTCL